MNDYEHRCFWENDGLRIDGNWRLLDVIDGDDESWWLNEGNKNKITIGSTKLNLFPNT